MCSLTQVLSYIVLLDFQVLIDFSLELLFFFSILILLMDKNTFEMCRDIMALSMTCLLRVSDATETTISLIPCVLLLWNYWDCFTW